jgi:carbon monoxide dehydrogenase subunit G
MDMTGERRIPAPRQTVWDALNDPEVLRASIPGCKTLEKTSDTDLKATAGIRIGPISASFTGKVQLLDLDPPNSYRIAGEGQGGVAGFANGGAVVRLADDGADTVLTYEVKAQVGGKIAQLGARLIDATAKQMADQFFDKFSAQVSSMSQPIPQQIPGQVAAPGASHAPGHVPEYGADGTLTGGVAAIRAVANAPATVSLFSLIPKEPGGFPLVFWIGSVIYLFIFFLIFGSLVF